MVKNMYNMRLQRLSFLLWSPVVGHRSLSAYYSSVKSSSPHFLLTILRRQWRFLDLKVPVMTASTWWRLPWDWSSLVTWCYLPEKWACHSEGLGLSTFCKLRVHWPPLRTCHFYRQLITPWELRFPVSQGAFLKDWAGLDIACTYRQFLQLPHKREEIVHTCICMAESLHCPPETIITLLIGYTPIQKKKLTKKKPEQTEGSLCPSLLNFKII